MLGANKLPTPSADGFYTSGVKGFMLAPHFSPEQQKNSALTHRQVSRLKRYPSCPSHPRRAMLSRQITVTLIREYRRCDLGVVFATSKGLAPAARQRLMARGRGRSGHAGLAPPRALGSSPGERVVQLHPMNISMLSVNAP